MLKTTATILIVITTIAFSLVTSNIFVATGSTMITSAYAKKHNTDSGSSSDGKSRKDRKSSGGGDKSGTSSSLSSPSSSDNTSGDTTGHHKHHKSDTSSSTTTTTDHQLQPPQLPQDTVQSTIVGSPTTSPQTPTLHNPSTPPQVGSSSGIPGLLGASTTPLPPTPCDPAKDKTCQPNSLPPCDPTKGVCPTPSPPVTTPSPLPQKCERNDSGAVTDLDKFSIM